MRREFPVVAICALALAISPCLASGVDAESVLEQLKSLAGTWRGETETTEAEPAGKDAHGGDVTHEFRVSAAGTVVMETMFQGTGHEMINMYHLDGEDLMLTHYCAGGNQPTMRLDRARSTPRKLVFEFTGGTNLDPAVDGHIHSAEITLTDDKHVRSTWTSWAKGKQEGVTAFNIARSE